jgi:competence protein ComEA
MQAAGGTTGSANPSGLRLYIPVVGEAQQPQKVNINRAEMWLLEALPGIGETLAQRIIDYRQQNGPFRNIKELTKVAGIGTAKYEQIADLITVAD